LKNNKIMQNPQFINDLEKQLQCKFIKFVNILILKMMVHRFLFLDKLIVKQLIFEKYDFL